MGKLIPFLVKLNKHPSASKILPFVNYFGGIKRIVPSINMRHIFLHEKYYNYDKSPPIKVRFVNCPKQYKIIRKSKVENQNHQ
jgi:hypothetical protein